MLLKWHLLVFLACVTSVVYMISTFRHLSTHKRLIIPDATNYSSLVPLTISPASLPIPHTNQSVCIITASSSRNTNWKTAQDSYVAKIMYPSIIETIEPHLYHYSVFVGYDADDTYWNTPANRFKGVTWVSVQNPLHKPGPVFNHVAKQAYLQNCDYYFRINDDTKILSHNWTTIMITLLREKLNNTGVIGPVCHQGNTAIFTHDFVHKTHLQIFENYYNPEFPDWWLDDWITDIYKKLDRAIVATNVEVIHNLKETRYQVSIEKEKILQQEVEKDVEIIRKHSVFTTSTALGTLPEFWSNINNIQSSSNTSQSFCAPIPAIRDSQAQAYFLRNVCFGHDGSNIRHLPTDHIHLSCSHTENPYGNPYVFVPNIVTDPNIFLDIKQDNRLVIIGDCWHHGTNPSHLLYGLYQSQILTEWALSQQLSVSTVVLRKCDMTIPYAQYPVLRDILDTMLQKTNATFIQLPSNSEYSCFHNAVFFPRYSMPPRLASFQQGVPLPSRNNITIAIFQRSTGTHLRKICNIDEVQSLVAHFTPHPVQIITTNEHMPVADQVAIFNTTDFLITPHGSHLAVAFLASRVKFVLELCHQHHDKFAFNYQFQKADNAKYFVSWKHKLANNDCHEDVGAYQNQDIQSCNQVFQNVPALITDYDTPDCRSYSAKQSNMIIDLQLLEAAMQQIYLLFPN